MLTETGAENRPCTRRVAGEGAHLQHPITILDRGRAGVGCILPRAAIHSFRGPMLRTIARLPDAGNLAVTVTATVTVTVTAAIAMDTDTVMVLATPTRKLTPMPQFQRRLSIPAPRSALGHRRRAGSTYSIFSMHAA